MYTALDADNVIQTNANDFISHYKSLGSEEAIERFKAAATSLNVSEELFNGVSATGEEVFVLAYKARIHTDAEQDVIDYMNDNKDFLTFVDDDGQLATALAGQRLKDFKYSSVSKVEG